MVAFIPVLNILAVIAILVAVVLLVFVSIREIVYLWQTAKICEVFAEYE